MLWKVVDVLIIDGILNAGAFLVELAGDLLRFLQTGNVRNYALTLLPRRRGADALRDRGAFWMTDSLGDRLLTVAHLLADGGRGRAPPLPGVARGRAAMWFALGRRPLVEFVALRPALDAASTSGGAGIPVRRARRLGPGARDLLLDRDRRHLAAADPADDAPHAGRRCSSRVTHVQKTCAASALAFLVLETGHARQPRARSTSRSSTSSGK